MKKTKQLRWVMAILLTLIISQVSVHAQSLKKSAKTLVASIENKDVDALISHYADSVHYQDAIWGADDIFDRATIRGFYEPMFAAESDVDVRISTIALDEKDGSILLKGTSYDKTEKGRLPFVVYMRFEKGKIVEQMDFPVYAVASLKASPRYKPFFK